MQCTNKQIKSSFSFCVRVWVSSWIHMQMRFIQASQSHSIPNGNENDNNKTFNKIIICIQALWIRKQQTKRKKTSFHSDFNWISILDSWILNSQFQVLNILNMCNVQCGVKLRWSMAWSPMLEAFVNAIAIIFDFNISRPTFNPFRT